MRRAGQIAAAFVLSLAAPLAAQVAGPDADVALERTVRDDERGVRAIIRYRPEVMSGGQDELVNEDGTISTLYWDGFFGQFEAEMIEGDLAPGDVKAFLREAVIAVCPSVDTDLLAGEWVQVSGNRLRIFAQCPEVDATLE